MQGTVTFSSGSVRLKSNIIDRDGTAPSAVQWSSDSGDNKTFSFYDKDGELISYWRVSRQTDQRIGWNLLAWNEKTDGTSTYGGGIAGFVDRTGASSYSISDPTAFREAIGNGNANAFMRADGTLSRMLEGNVPWTTKYTSFNMKSSTNGISSDIWPGGLQVLDTNGLAANFYGATIGTNGAVGAGIHAYNYNSSGTQVGHSSLTIYIKKDGTTEYGITAADAFRYALGMDTWTSITQANYLTLESNWSLNSFSTSYNAALKRMRITIYPKTTVARSSGNIQIGTVKAGYRPPGRITIGNTASSTDAAAMYIENSGAIMLSIPAGGWTANTVNYFAGDYCVM